VVLELQDKDLQVVLVGIHLEAILRAAVAAALAQSALVHQM
jgi:hypothetical protein